MFYELDKFYNELDILYYGLDTFFYELNILYNIRTRHIII